MNKIRIPIELLIEIIESKDRRTYWEFTTVSGNKTVAQLVQGNDRGREWQSIDFEINPGD